MHTKLQIIFQQCMPDVKITFNYIFQFYQVTGFVIKLLVKSAKYFLPARHVIEK